MWVKIDPFWANKTYKHEQGVTDWNKPSVGIALLNNNAQPFKYNSEMVDYTTTLTVTLRQMAKSFYHSFIRSRKDKHVRWKQK